MAGFTNMTKGIGFVKIIKVTGRRKAPGLGMNEDGTKGRVPALLGETWQWVGGLYIPQIQHPTFRGCHRVVRPVQAGGSSQHRRTSGDDGKHVD